MISPLYTSADGAVQLYCMDAMDVLTQLAPASIDAVITDPLAEQKRTCVPATPQEPGTVAA